MGEGLLRLTKVPASEPSPRGAGSGSGEGLLRLCVVVLSLLTPALAHADARVFVIDDLTRVRGDDGAAPGRYAAGTRVWSPEGGIKLDALRGETVAFQIAVSGVGEPVDGVGADVDGLTGLVVDRFVEHFVEVRARSRNERRPRESLGWSPAARPADEEQLGLIPDALIPVDLAPAWSPYPMTVPPGQTRLMWVDIFVPDDVKPGPRQGTVKLRSRRGALEKNIPITVDVSSARLPYRPVSVFAYYQPVALEERVGALRETEPALWRVLHAHHVDPLPPYYKEEHVDRLRPLWDGSAFRADVGYRGPGQGMGVEVVALGAYGALGEFREDKLPKIRALTAALPKSVEDAFLYAVDESCKSDAGPKWRAGLRAAGDLGRLRVGHTCSADPRQQDVDLVLMTGQAFSPAAAHEARKQGRLVWTYNGALPQWPTMMLDAPPSALGALGWMAASYDTGRWFLWETIFWTDDNRGGKGQVDPFATAETFHNRDGDAVLMDGLLLYPGTQRDRFTEHSAGHKGVFPSIRLKALRRGIQDAGLVALARKQGSKNVDAKVDEILRRAMPAAFTDASEERPASFALDGSGFAEGRKSLRALIPSGASLDGRDARRLLGASARIPGEPMRLKVPDWRKLGKKRLGALMMASVVALAGVVLAVRRFRRG